ncbi:MAG: phage tail tape measure protein, partial [Gemmatimonadota bacterium]
ELASSLGQVTPQAAKLEIGYRALSAAVAAVSKQGIVTSEVVTGLRMALTNVTKATPKATKAAKKFGVDFSEAGLKAAGGMFPFFKQLVEKTGGSVTALGQFFESTEAVKTVLALTSKTGAATFLQAMADMESGVQHTDAAFRKVEATTGFQVRRMQADFSSLMRTVGTELLPVVREAANALSEMLGSVQDDPRAIRTTMRELAGGLRKVLATAKEAVGWVRDNFDRLIAVGKQLISTWLKFKALQIGMGLGQAVAGGVGFINVMGSQGIGAAFGMLRSNTVQTAGQMRSLGKVIGPGIVSMRGLPVDVSDLKGELKTGVSKFSWGLGVAGAAMAGWEIGQWLNAIGADELVYRGLRGMFGGGGTTLGEASKAERVQSKAQVRAQQERRLLRQVDKLGVDLSKYGVQGEISPRIGAQGNLISSLRVPGMQSALAATLVKTASQVGRLRSGVAAGKLAPEFAGMGKREREEFGALVRDIRKGAYDDVLAGVGTSLGKGGRDVDKLLAAFEKLATRDVNVNSNVQVDVDSRSLAKGLGRAKARENARGAAGRRYTAAERNRILRSGVEIIRGPQPVGI